ncbi:phosphatidate cytidylyltransferase [Baffinella frigidus]|nr:phosphatidate cytidylyltransferase [Cryptophyta sp. CCMP2293]
MPLSYMMIVAYLLLRRSANNMKIADVQTTFMGMFYVGYLSSFWVRLRALGVIPSEAILASTWIPAWLVAYTPDIFTQGAVVTWWTMISIAASDVGAYFAGKNFGKTKLSEFTGISVSPNKTMEGVYGGVLLCSIFATTGAYLMHWPLWWFTGPFYGTMISLLGLLGDLTVSLFKRDAGMKDTGSLLPGHGGILDRLDSYMLTAAPCYFFIKLLSKFQGYESNHIVFRFQSEF